MHLSVGAALPEDLKQNIWHYSGKSKFGHFKLKPFLGRSPASSEATSPDIPSNGKPTTPPLQPIEEDLSLMETLSVCSSPDVRNFETTDL